jgi:hypothetical protein
MQSWNDDVRGLFTKVSSNIFIVGTSGTQFPNVEGNKHIVSLLTSGAIYIGGASTVNSGLGFLIVGDPVSSPRATLELKQGNLNTIYGIGLTSTIITIISFS